MGKLRPTFWRKSDVNGVKSFERAYARERCSQREYEQGCGGGALLEYGNWNCTLARERKEDRIAWTEREGEKERETVGEAARELKGEREGGR